MSREQHGIYYTDEETILRVIRPLFLDTLEGWLERCNSPKYYKKLHRVILGMTFLDPACGACSILRVIFKHLQRIEGVILEHIDTEERVSNAQCMGIELNDAPTHGFPVTRGNALRLPWPKVQFIVGNPPFKGGGKLSKEQKEDRALVFKGVKGIGQLDYAACWYLKAAQQPKPTRTAFISTNSVCQGVQVPILWAEILKLGHHINFFAPPFAWKSDAENEASVICIIVGFWRRKRKGTNINPYLVEGPDVLVTKRSKPLGTGVPPMALGARARDGGHLLMTEEEKDELIRECPLAEKWIQPFMGAKEFLHDIPRYCLWLEGTKISEIKNSPGVMRRLRKVREMRLASKRPATRELASKPHLFSERNRTKGPYVAVPLVTSSRRLFIPAAYVTDGKVLGDTAYTLPGASLYHFGILNSTLHNAWMRAVSGRMKSDYRYSNTVVYNNFVWPMITAEMKRDVEVASQGILDARALYPDMCLADLYDPDKMPSELEEAHRYLDVLVNLLYGFEGSVKESQLVARMFELYAEAKENNDAR